MTNWSVYAVIRLNAIECDCIPYFNLSKLTIDNSLSLFAKKRIRTIIEQRNVKPNDVKTKNFTWKSKMFAQTIFSLLIGTKKRRKQHSWKIDGKMIPSIIIRWIWKKFLIMMNWSMKPRIEFNEFQNLSTMHSRISRIRLQNVKSWNVEILKYAHIHVVFRLSHDMS